jgi:hypothetical protein
MAALAFRQTVGPSWAAARHGVKQGLRPLWVGTRSEEWPDLCRCSGLLDGVGHPTNATFYATNMDMKRAAEMVSLRGRVYEAAELDVGRTNKTIDQYLSGIEVGVFTLGVLVIWLLN